MATSPKLSASDRLNTYILGHVRAIETVLMLMWNTHPDRAAVKADAKHWLEAIAALDLDSESSDEEIAIRQQAHAAAIDAMFVELVPASGDASAHKP